MMKESTMTPITRLQNYDDIRTDIVQLRIPGKAIRVPA
jgi:hypothetical protein